MDWIETSSEEMYISNYPPENMKLKINLFSIPQKASEEEPYSQTISIRWKRTHRESRVETSLSDLKSELTQFEQTDPNGEERLYVYANLEKKFDGDWDPRHRTEILRIRHDGNGHFWFKPDLNGGRPPYKISTHSAVSSLEWRYKIEGIQVGPLQEIENIGILPPPIAWTQPAPSEKFRQTFIFGEVLKSEGFEYPYVSVMVKNSCDSQTVVTHSVSPRDGARNYSFPFEFQFTHGVDESCPELIVEAVSFGYFNNRRIEGYGYGCIPDDPGSHEVTIPCWRPTGGVYEELRRSFLGGTGEFISLNPIGHANSNSKKISRIGLQTVSTGTVTLRLKIIRLHSARILKPKSGVNIIDNEQTVLDAFQKARDKMLRIKQNIPKHLIKS